MAKCERFAVKRANHKIQHLMRGVEIIDKMLLDYSRYRGKDPYSSRMSLLVFFFFFFFFFHSVIVFKNIYVKHITTLLSQRIKSPLSSSIGLDPFCHVDTCIQHFFLSSAIKLRHQFNFKDVKIQTNSLHT